MGFDLSSDFLGKAANEKDLAKTAIKEKRFDDAWGHLNNQKGYYLRHANRMGFSKTDTLVIDSSPHEDMANILRLEGKHAGALSNISYTYKTIYSAKRPIITLEKKLEAYYNRAYKKQSFDRFLSLLQALPNSDFVSVRDFVEIYYPMAPTLSDERALLDEMPKKIKTIQTKQQHFRNTSETPKSEKKYKGVIHIKPKDHEAQEVKYPEPTYLKTSNISQNINSENEKIFGHSTADWIIGLIVGFIVLMVFIWIIS